MQAAATFETHVHRKLVLFFSDKLYFRVPDPFFEHNRTRCWWFGFFCGDWLCYLLDLLRFARTNFPSFRSGRLKGLFLLLRLMLFLDYFPSPFLSDLRDLRGLRLRLLSLSFWLILPSILRLQ